MKRLIAPLVVLFILLPLTLFASAATAQEQLTKDETRTASFRLTNGTGEEYDHVFKAKPQGDNEIPPVDTKAHGNFVAHVDMDYTGFSFKLVVNNIKNVVAAHIHLGMPGENGPPVATLFGPADPGGGRHNGLLAKGTIMASDLFGPLEGKTIVALVEEIKAGNAYINVHTNDGEGEDNTGPGDMMSGEIRDQIEVKGMLPPALARLQVIHNAADPAAAEVDVYVGDALLLDNFAFRAATPYIDVPAGIELAIGVAPGTSTGPGDIIATFPVTLAVNETYAVVANGVLDPSGFAANPDGRDIAFTLFPKAGAREMAMDYTMVDFFAFHGSTDAPTVDVIARGVATLVDDAAYGDMTGYLSVPPASYILDVTPGSDNATIVASFEADLSGLAGGAAVVFASGFLSPVDNQDGAAFGLFAALPDGSVVEFPVYVDPEPTARLQVIHNAADPGAASVDVYVGDALLLDDFAFRTATPYIDVPAEVELVIGVAPGTSTGPGDIIATFPVTLADGETYAVVANGVLDPSGFAANPDGRDIAFTLFTMAGAREAATDMGNVDFFALHGSTDAPTVDVIARGVATLVDDAAYGDMTGYLSVPPASYILDVTPGDDNATIVASFEADLSGLAGGAAVVFASGFLTPAANQNGEPFGLFAALPDGSVVEFPALTASRLQVIHNAADPGAAVVDIYVDNALIFDDFAFRTATPYLDVPGNMEFVIGVAPGTSTGPGDIIATFPVTLMAGETYAVIANGVLDPSGFAANPDGRDIAFTLFPKAGAREAAMDASLVDFFAFHGSTDAPTVDVIARGVATLVDDAAYGDMTGYLSVPPASYILDVTPGDDNATIVASFEADLSGLAGGAAVVFASGFLTPAANQNGEPFGLFAALPDGSVVEFPLYVDGNTEAYERFWTERDEPTIADIQALSRDSGAGIMSDGDRLMLMTGDDGDNNSHLFYAYLNGFQEVPPHWTISSGIFTAKVNNEYTGLRYSLYGWYLKNVVAAHIHLGKRGENGPPVATLYGPVEPGSGWIKRLHESGVITEADLMGPLAGRPLTELIDALASGDAYVNVHTDDGLPGDNTGIGDYISGEIRGQIRLYGTLPEPPVPTTARLQVIHNAADPAAAEVDIYVNGDLLLDNFAFRAATPYIDVPGGVELEIGVAPGTSTGPGDIIATFPVTLTAGETYAVIANGVLDPSGFAANPDGRDIAFTLFPKAGAREAAMDASLVDFFAFHGSTDAPTVDVIARGVATLVDDAAYGDMTGYLSVPPASYILDVTPGGDNATIVASFEADLSGLAGGAAVVFASGFLTPAANQNGEPFGLFAALPDGSVVEFPALTTARLQVIHNAADPGASVVDVYIDDGLALDDFAFRAATPYLDVPGNTEFVIGVAPGTSTGPGDIIATFPVTLMAGETYVVFANGVLDPSGFAANPDGRDIAFTLFPKAGARETAMDASLVDFFAFHGSTDAPTVDVIARGVATLVDDAAYGDMTGYLSVPPASYILDVTPGGDNATIVASFEADLSGLAGGAAVVFASGFLDPASNQAGPAFGLFAALPDGSVVEFPPAGPPVPTARLQVIHNAADPAASSVDVYIDDGLALDDFAFRTATPYIDVPAGVEFVIGIAPGSSTGPGDILATFPVTLEADETYVAIASGVLDPSGFAANPNGRDTGFTLFVKADAREAAVDPAMVEFFAFHGATDAPMVDVYVFFGQLVVNDAKYGDMTGYTSLAPKQQTALILADYSGLWDFDYSVVGLYNVDLTGLGGGAAVVFASGFINPLANQNGEGFGLFAALPDGSVVEFPRYTYSKAEAQALASEILKPGQNDMPAVETYGLEQNHPNPFNPVTTIAFSIPSREHVTLKVYDVAGREVATLVNGTRPAGRHEVSFEAMNISSGIYFYRLRAGEYLATRKMIVVR